MSHSVVPTVANGDSWSAAQNNTYLRDNIAAIWVGTTAGDMDYYTGAHDKSRLALVVAGVLIGGATAPSWLAKPGAGLFGFLKNTAAGSVSWFTGGASDARKILRVNAGGTDFELVAPGGEVDDSGFAERSTLFSHSTNTSDWTDVTDLTMDLTLTVACTIRAWFTGRWAAMNAAGGGMTANLRIMINGVAQTSGTEPQLSAAPYNAFIPVAAFFMDFAVPAGTRTVKVQVKKADDTAETLHVSGNLFAEAIRE